ncbi:hydrolase [Humibacillus sp. DSM 29435]|uniref:alpha/beta fold hydrolase n=1 Tax=Humibacillus sp. DSM 29435 TaxID=1869167 RepID=UPI0008729290|nr:alpha/beta hydrolase [Humibacillus sp. DSM 29435]OFE15192.1 hydrolase [Humibacillus sp. DSM 29435]
MELVEYDRHRRTVDTQAGEIGYAEFGTGRTALFVHGVGTGGSLWRNVISALEGERRCLAVDLPLHGRTPAAPGQDYSLTGLAASVEAFCVALGLTDIDLVGQDTGGAVAQIVAAHRPERLTTLTLTNCETRGDVPPRAFAPTVWLARARLLAPLTSRALTDLTKTRKRLFGTGYQDVEALPLDVLRDWLEPLLGTPLARREFQRWVASLRDRDLVAVDSALRQLTVPTLLAWGTDDRFFPLSRARRLRDTIPGVRELVEIDGARLFYPEERAADLVPHLRRHWAAYPAG